jgi:hypothetical protein
MVARDATLTLHDNRIDAEAVLREPKSDRSVTRAVIATICPTVRAMPTCWSMACASTRRCNPMR